jgi:protein-tyrosine phosphatase
MQPTLFTISTPTPGRLSTMARPRGGDWLEDELTALSREVNVLVCLLTEDELAELNLQAERDVAIRTGLHFHHFPIEDRQLPGAGADALIASLTAELREGRHLALHCRAGIGRSSLMAAGILRTLGLDAAEALSRISAARGLQVPDTQAQADWVHAFTPR